MQALSGGPDQQNENPNERNVGIAIGHCLTANLNDTDYREQSGKVPKPSDEEIAVSTPSPTKDGERKKSNARKEHDKKRKAPLRVRIEDRESHGPECFDNVKNIRQQGILNANTQGKDCGRT